MTGDACIGWRGDTPCPLGDEFHGCKLAEDVTHGYHVCGCGARLKRAAHELNYRKRQRAPIAAADCSTISAIDDPGSVEDGEV